MPTGDFKITHLNGTTTPLTDIHTVTWTDKTSGVFTNPTGSCGYTITYPPVDTPEDIKFPKCLSCGKEVEALSSYVKKNSLIIILRCHGDERRIDISLKRFKDSKEDAIEWFEDTFRYVFDEDKKWRNVQPERKVSTVHADRKIISDWLDTI